MGHVDSCLALLEKVPETRRMLDVSKAVRSIKGKMDMFKIFNWLGVSWGAWGLKISPL